MIKVHHPFALSITHSAGTYLEPRGRIRDEEDFSRYGLSGCHWAQRIRVKKGFGLTPVARMMSGSQIVPGSVPLRKILTSQHRWLQESTFYAST